MRLLGILTAAFSFAILSGCMRVPLQKPEAAMRPHSVPFLQDDLNFAGLIDALSMQADALSGQDRIMVFGPNKIHSREYAEEIRKIAALWHESKDREKVLRYILQNFEFLEVYGQKRWGEVHVTAYFEPVIEGSLTPSERFSEPLYKRPEDLISIDLEEFDPKFSNERKMRGRLVNGKLIPYYTRDQISRSRVLKGRGLEICWVDPVDGFFLQIQGSGVIKLQDGREMKLNYAEKNGQPYRSIANLIKDFTRTRPLTLKVIEDFLRIQPKDKLPDFLAYNPSYVFFVPSEHNAITSSGLPATPGRTIASDKRYFPEGALAYLEFPDPEISGNTIRRLVLDQDSGGAILGGGRIDLFWGRGQDSKYVAGAVNHQGNLYYLFPKAKLVSSF